jgi:hypothetical protein
VYDIPEKHKARWSHSQCARRANTEAEQRSQRSVIGWVIKVYYLELRAPYFGAPCFGRHVKPLVPAAFAVVSTSTLVCNFLEQINVFYLLIRTNPYWARMIGYDLFSLCVIHKEGLCPSSGDINRLMMMMIYLFIKLAKDRFVR